MKLNHQIYFTIKKSGDLPDFDILCFKNFAKVLNFGKVAKLFTPFHPANYPAHPKYFPLLYDGKYIAATCRLNG